MSSRIRELKTSRVVDRPAAAALATSASLAVTIGATTSSSSSRCREAVVELGDLLVGASRERGEGRDGGVRGPRRGLLGGGGDVQQVAGVLDDDQPVARPERLGEGLVDIRHPVAPEHDRLAGDQVIELLGHSVSVRGLARSRRAAVP